jgi:hypothetical protein
LLVVNCHVVYDLISSSETLDAFETVYGEELWLIMIFQSML